MMTPPLLQSLVSGGDERLVLDPLTGANRYGIGCAPADAIIGLGSATASTISGRAFAAVQSLHARVLEEAGQVGAAAVYAREAAGIRARIAALIGTGSAGGSAPGEVLLGPSGTDVHLLAALLYNYSESSPLLVVTLGANETGSGVPLALQGCHFARQPPHSDHRPFGAALSSAKPIVSHELAVRDGSGRKRSGAEIERELDQTIADARKRGMRCLLVMADVSKTGLITPGPDVVMRLRARHGAALEILVDACQARLAPATMRAYAELGFPVVITGSKFIGGPPFSGAMLCPPALARRFAEVTLPADTGCYTVAGDWPEAWAARAQMPQRANFGLLLRWHAALLEWDAFLQLPADRVHRITAQFASAVRTRLEDDPAFIPLAFRPPDRSALLGPVGAAGGFDTEQTIFPFLLASPSPVAGDCGVQSVEETRRIYELLRRGRGPDGSPTSSPPAAPIQLGQPVSCGVIKGQPVAALRLCLGARLVVGACEKTGGVADLVATAMEALDRTALLAAGHGLRAA